MSPTDNIIRSGVGPEYSLDTKRKLVGVFAPGDEADIIVVAEGLEVLSDTGSSQADIRDVMPYAGEDPAVGSVL